MNTQLERISIVNKTLLISKVDEIANVLTTSWKHSRSTDLTRGTTGIALFLAYYGRYKKSGASIDLSNKLVSNAADSMANFGFYTSFAGGTSGVCWGILHLIRNDFYEADEGELFDEIDELINEQMQTEIRNDNYDFLHGALGMANYLIERHSEKSKQYVIDVLTQLEKNAIVNETTRTAKWKSYIAGENETKIPTYNLGLSHGMTSIIVVLCNALKSDKLGKIQTASIEKLIIYTINYINQHRNNSQCNSIFPSYVPLQDSGESIESPLEWSYGDLGIASALWQTGKILNNLTLKKEAIEIMKNAAARIDIQKDNFIDAAFCHGSAGIAHIFNRFYKETGIQEFDDARCYWLQITIDNATIDEGLAGYQSLRSTDVWTNEMGVLEGIAGIGLVMLGFLTESVDDLNWDSCFLMS